jgi:hypothetical protein
MTTIVVLFVIGLAAPQERAPQDKPRIPKDSIELVIIGCLKGRVLAVSDVRQPDVESNPDVRARSFRLAGKGDVMKDVKREDKHFVEVTGVVKRSSLAESGFKVGKGIVINGGRPVAGSGGVPAPSEYLPVMDVESIRLRSTSCTGAS